MEADAFSTLWSLGSGASSFGSRAARAPAELCSALCCFLGAQEFCVCCQLSISTNYPEQMAHTDLNPILRMRRMALMRRELFFLQDVALINKIITSPVRVAWQSRTSLSVYLVWKCHLQISSEPLCLAWLSSLPEPALWNKPENHSGDLFWQQTIHLLPCPHLSALSLVAEGKQKTKCFWEDELLVIGIIESWNILGWQGSSKSNSIFSKCSFLITATLKRRPFVDLKCQELTLPEPLIDD